MPGWNEVGFDDSGWKNAQRAQAPTGTPRICEAEPIVVAREISPVSVTMQEDGALYDFGVNTAGVCRLKIQGKAGQVLSLYHGEVLVDGRLNRRNISFSDNDYVQKDIYICKGNGEEIYVPTFTYHGFRYVFVKGMTAQQATSDALTYLEMYSDLKELGGFSCSDSIVNKLQEITRRSDLANFYYFPTDCPQREKNGWTADAALSAEHMLLNLSAEVSFREWMRNICKAQADNGALPGIIPTGGWGFGWGNGPAWDCVLVYLPYFTYLYRGDRKILEENAHAILRYLDYLTTQIRPDGLIAIGLGDWCPVGRSFDKYKAPLELTDTVVSMDICEKAAAIFDWLGRTEQKKFAQGIYARLRTAARERLIDFSTMTAHGNCQTSQVMAIFYNVFEPAEKQAAFARLLDLIYERDNRMDVGVLGGRVLFHVLSSFGFSDLAYEMITMPGYPSYANWIERGATSLWEDFQPEGGSIASLNHHFWGDISHWFIRWLGGIHYNTHLLGNEVDIAPAFVEKLNHAEAYYIAPEGRIEAKWKRQGDGVILSTVVPEGMNGYIRLPDGYEFEDGIKTIPVVSGEFNVKRTESVLA
ncbi:MAG TPA: hypothetical protein DEB10_06810 [Ruminococcaceae bacterium]|nr:hypothetical protein [Oscillospiraceae bacterium]